MQPYRRARTSPIFFARSRSTGNQCQSGSDPVGPTQPLQDPTLEVRDGNGGLIAFENDWQDNTPTAVKAALLQPQDSRESAVVLSLPAGKYTAIVRGKNGTTGVALVEAYRLQ